MEFYNDLLGKAGGWLHWPEDWVLDADVNYVALALENHLEMLEQLFGSSKNKPQSGRPKKDKWELPERKEPINLTPDIFDRMFPGDRPTEIKVK